MLFGIQTSVLIVAVFTAFVGYQFRLREKKRDMAHSELIKSYNDFYSPILFVIREINELPQSEERNDLINKLFTDYGLGSSKGHLIGSVNMLNTYFELNALFRAFKHQPDAYEAKFLKCLKEFEVMIDQEFWDAHDIIYKEHNRYKDHNFKPLKSLFIDLLGTLKFVSDFAMSVCLLTWFTIGYAHIFNIEAFSVKAVGYITGFTVIVILIFVGSFMYSKLFYSKTNNRRERKK
ncbi:hypothetical protein P40081_26225 [Paenibacillus sp. FSL P4-0081]|uniref:hypothetical protein n=1 Tax=Paenibacillus sp. FSL P4-0081 TaxID=1536769 RepID=UPI0004F5C068|nr:hypothetical protein [Paenibacillus sp. FSL P4-0081]AIQ31270.1 hypothetical protein P40081_26225 [Paenibacillus sp. FSL P4-0081]